MNKQNNNSRKMKMKLVVIDGGTLVPDTASSLS